MPKILALDYGQNKIGIAVGETEHGFAFARAPILIADPDAIWPALQIIMDAEQPDEIVVGLPKNTDGTEGEQARRVRAFVDEAAAHLKTPIKLWDERLTTQAVQKEHAGRDLARGVEDSFAAQLLLENYLSARP